MKNHKCTSLDGSIGYSDTYYDQRVCPKCQKAFYPREPDAVICALCTRKARKAKTEAK